MERFSTKRLVLSALFAALVCATTMSIRIPTPGASGYTHPGGAIVILCGVFLDPISAFLAANIGSCMVDLLEGYFAYVPIAFVIRGLMAFSASHVCRNLRARGIDPHVAVAGCSATGIVLAVGGCCMYEVSPCGLDTVLASIPSNIVQGISGLIVFGALYPVLQKPLSMTLKT